MSSWSGVFGKTPQTGDFVSHGMPPKGRRQLDLWVSRNLASRDGPWPTGGLRGLLALDGGLALFLAVPSRDSAGRRFPLVAATDGRGLSFEVAETWCDAVLPALLDAAKGARSVDEVLQAVDSVADLPRNAETGEPALWTLGGSPADTSADVLDGLFSSG